MKVFDIVESFDPIPSLNVDSLISKILAERDKYPAGSLTPRSVVTEMIIEDVSRAEAEKICNDLASEITTTIFKFHDKLAKAKTSRINTPKEK